MTPLTPAEVSRRVHTAAHTATNLLTLTSELLDLAPRRGELTERLLELAEAVRQAEADWRDADDAILHLAQIEWHRAHQKHTPIPLERAWQS